MSTGMRSTFVFDFNYHLIPEFTDKMIKGLKNATKGNPSLSQGGEITIGNMCY